MTKFERCPKCVGAGGRSITDEFGEQDVLPCDRCQGDGFVEEEETA